MQNIRVYPLLMVTEQLFKTAHYDICHKALIFLDELQNGIQQFVVQNGLKLKVQEGSVPQISCKRNRHYCQILSSKIICKNPTMKFTLGYFIVETTSYELSNKSGVFRINLFLSPKTKIVTCKQPVLYELHDSSIQSIYNIILKFWSFLSAKLCNQMIFLCFRISSVKHTPNY